MRNTGKILSLPTERYVFCPVRKIMIAHHIILEESLAGKIIKIIHVKYFDFMKVI